MLALLVEPIKADLRISDTSISLLTGFSFTVFYVLVGLPVARLADRGSRRNVIAVCMFSAALVAIADAISKPRPAVPALPERNES